MLTEYFNNYFKSNDIMPGARATVIAPANTEACFPSPVPVKLESMNFEALFCQTGSISLTRRSGTIIKAESREILIITDVSDLTDVRIDTPVSGVLISINVKRGSGTLHDLCKNLGNLHLDTKQVRRWMDERGGCAVIKQTSWTASVFEYLNYLDQDEWCRYCIIKSIELLYLLCCSKKADDPVCKRDGMSNSHLKIMTEMRQYIETHLSEHITINSLSRRFFISPTAVKANFRSLYGQTVHSWLLQKRMEYAAKLLADPSKSVLGIAQSVGYCSVSQFSAAFRRFFGTTPGKYRKSI